MLNVDLLRFILLGIVRGIWGLFSILVVELEFYFRFVDCFFRIVFVIDESRFVVLYFELVIFCWR